MKMLKSEAPLMSLIYLYEVLDLTKFWITNSIHISERVYVYDIKIGMGQINHNLYKTDKTRELLS